MGVVNGVLAWLTDPVQWSGPDGIPVRTLQHLWYSLLATTIAAAIALPIGVYIGHTGRGALFAVNLTNLGRAIPSLGIIILMFTIFGFGIIPVLVTLFALAIPPIVTNSYIGVRSVDPDVRQAAEGMGMRGRQVLWQVELPMATPLIMAGIRTSAVQVVATATLAAFVGLGGLGRYLIDGLAQRDLAEVVGGAILVAALSLLTELVLGRVRPRQGREGRIVPGRQGPKSTERTITHAKDPARRRRARRLPGVGPGRLRRRGRRPRGGHAAQRAVERDRRLDQLLRAAHPGPDVRRRAREGRRRRHGPAEPGQPGGRVPGAGERRDRPAARVQRLGAVVPQARRHRDHLRRGQHRPDAAARRQGPGRPG